MSAPWPHTLLGSRNTPAVLFLHGFLGRKEDWFPIARTLAGDFFCILTDLPGHGENPAAGPPGTLSFDRLTEELDQLVQHLQVPRLTLVGYSLGGRAALHYACSRGRHLHGLVLESTSPGIEDPASRLARAALDDRRAAALEAGGLAAFLDSWYRADLWRSLQQRPNLLRQLKTDRVSGDPSSLARALADLSPGRMPDLWPCLQGISNPVLLLAGELDDKYTATTRLAADLIPGGHARIIPGAGHNIHLEQPEKVAQAIQEFLQALN